MRTSPDDGEDYEGLSASRALSMREMLKVCLDVTGSDTSFVWVPAEVLERHDVSAWCDLPA